MSDDPNSPILLAIAGLSAKLDQVREELSAGLGQVRQEVRQVRDELRAELGQVRDELRAGLGQVRQEVHQVRDELRAELGQVRDELRAELAQVRSDVMERIDRLQDRMATHQEADLVNFGAAERAERIATTARADVATMGEQINALVRMVRNLSQRLEAVEDKQ